MKKQFYLLALGFLFSLQLMAQCPEGVAIKNTTPLPTTCTSTDGKFTITVTPAQSPALYESSYDGGVTWFQHTSGNADNNVTNKAAGIYNIIVRNIATQSVCTNKQFVLRSNYASGFTASPVNATGCNIADGKIVLSNVSSTDLVSWISSTSPNFVTVSSLNASTISNLKPGSYYVIIKSPSGNQCFSTKTITVGNSGAACPAATFCTNAYGTNKFPNGTFGSGASLNGPALPASESTYGYTQLAHRSPDDGFYAIARTTSYDGGSGQVFDKWTITTDHTGDANGYMMIVNASFDQDIVTEKTIAGLCPNKTYQFSAWIKNIKPESGAIKPDLAFLIDGVGKFSTGDVAGADWVNVGFTFKSSGTNAKFSIRNNNPGGDGNDWVIDDILVAVCAPTIEMNPVNGSNCLNPATSVSSTITDVSNIYDKYKWQVNKNDGQGFMDATNGTGTGTFDVNHQYTATLITDPSPLSSFQHGWIYRIIVAEDDADFVDADCNYVNSKTLVIAQCGAVLPVKFNGLNAMLNNNAGIISWKVAEQTNIKLYEVEKSTDGIHFNKIATVSNNFLTIYSADDKSLTDGINYYRIKVINNDGKYSYSSIVTLALKGNTGSVRIFPNPVQDRLFIWMPANTKINNIVIFDAVGKKLTQKAIVSNSTNVSDMNVRNLPKGVYRIQITSSNNEITNLSFIKK